MSRRPIVLLGLAAACAAGACAVWLAAFVLPGGRWLDGRALETFTRVASPPLTPSIHGISVLADPWPFAIGAALLVAIALLRRRPLMAAAVPLVLLGANVTTQQLKPALAELRIVDLPGVAAVYPGSWPSGHATASMSLALCLVLVVGPQLRALAALLGAGYAIAVGYALVALGFHLPSDVVGGYLVAATFTLAGAAVLARLESERTASVRRPTPSPAALSAPFVAGSAAAIVLAAAVAVVAREPGAPLDVLQHPAAMLAGIGIAALSLALTTGLARVLRG